MGWIAITSDFDRSVPFRKIRWDVSGNLGNDGCFSELPNINTDGKSWFLVTGSQYGYAGENRFNLGNNIFSNHYYNFSDESWTAQTHTTLVEGTVYEFDSPIDLYWSGLFSTSEYQYASAKIQVFVEDPEPPLLIPTHNLYINGNRIN